MRRHGDIRKALLSAPGVTDADRSLPVPAVRTTGSPSVGSPSTRVCAGWPPRRGPVRSPAVAVKQAYKELAKLHHPDRETGNLERFQAISEA